MPAQLHGSSILLRSSDRCFTIGSALVSSPLRRHCSRPPRHIGARGRYNINMGTRSLNPRLYDRPATQNSHPQQDLAALLLYLSNVPLSGPEASLVDAAEPFGVACLFVVVDMTSCGNGELCFENIVSEAILLLPLRQDVAACFGWNLHFTRQAKLAMVKMMPRNGPGIVWVSVSQDGPK